MARSTVAVKFTGDASGLKGTIGQVEGKLGGLASKAAGAGKLLAGGLAVGGAGAVALGQQVLDLGGKLTAWRQKTSTVFEGSANDIRAWADKNNEAFGLTDDELAGLAAGFGDLLKPMGFTADQAATMSKDVVGLSGALSEWSGGTRSAAEVSEILAKAMLGERDGLKELGISISEADVSARLAAKGQDKLTGSALEQAKAIATQELIFEKSTDAQKAYAAGGNKALRASNDLKAKFGELKEQIADKLLPVVLKIVEWAQTKLPAAMRKAQEAFERIRPKIEAVVNFVREKWPQIQVVIQKVMETVSQIIKGVVSVITTLWNNFGNNILELVQRVWPRIQQVIEGAMKIIQGVIKTITSLIKGDWSAVWEGIKQTVSGVWSAIQGIVGTALEVLRSAIGVGLEIIGSVMKGAWDGITSTLSGVWSGITSTVSGALDDIVGFFTGIGGRISDAAGDVFGFLASNFKGAINTVIRAWNNFKIPSVTIGGWDIPGPGPNVPSFTTPEINFPNIPTLHSGGTFHAPNGAREGLALLETGERVLSRRESNQPQIIQVVLDGRVLGEVLANRAAIDNRNRAA